MDMIDPQNSERNNPERSIARRALVVAGGQAPELLAAVDEPLHPVAQPVERVVERPGPPLIALARNGRPNPAPPAVPADRSAAVAFVSRHPLRAQARPATPGA